MSNRTIAVDPSSTKTGWAAFDGPRCIDAGIVKPINASHEPRIRAHHMANGVIDLIREFQSDFVVIEIPSDHMHGRLNRATGLATYGLAVGVIMTEIAHRVPSVGIIHIRASEWIGKRTKRTRQFEARGVYSRYAPASDKGGDMSDAIMLGFWYTGNKWKGKR